MIFLKTEEEINFIRESSLLVSKTLAEIAKYIEPGVSTEKLDKIAEEFIRDNGAKPAFKGYRGFKSTLCTSVNEEVVHGIPGNKILKEGDIISVDCGVLKNDFYGDSAYTFAVGEINNDLKKLLKITKESLYKGIENAVVGKRIGDISSAIQNYVEHYGYGVVRELVGHGIGRNLHEKPEVPNYGKAGHGMKLKYGLTLAIEPMVTLGKKDILQLDDGWTIATRDNKPSAHFEHTIVVRNEKAEILSTFENIEKIEQKKEIYG